MKPSQWETTSAFIQVSISMENNNHQSFYPNLQVPASPPDNFHQPEVHIPPHPEQGQQWIPFENSTASFAPDSALAQFGLDYGKQMFGRSHSFISSYLVTLKYYFNVNNSYVSNKLKLLLFPFKHKSWKRRMSKQGETAFYLPPREDINAPDLYIPLMAFITYVLMIGVAFGTAYKFTPELLGMTMTSGLIVLTLEFVFIKLGFYLLNSNSVPIFDLLSYCGYKFVGVVISIFAGFLFGSLVLHFLLFATGACMFMFLVVLTHCLSRQVKTLRPVFPEQLDETGSPASNKRNYFLVGVGALQMIVMYYLAYDVPLLAEMQ